MVLIPAPAGKCRPHDAHYTRTVHLEIPLECPYDELRLQARRNVRVPVVEDVLAVDVGGMELAGVLHTALRFELTRRAACR